LDANIGESSLRSSAGERNAAEEMRQRTRRRHAAPPPPKTYSSRDITLSCLIFIGMLLLMWSKASLSKLQKRMVSGAGWLMTSAYSFTGYILLIYKKKIFYILTVVRNQTRVRT